MLLGKKVFVLLACSVFLMSAQCAFCQDAYKEKMQEIDRQVRQDSVDLKDKNLKIKK